jgi:hypothetical protein
MTPQYVQPGDTVELILPHSEVCMHMKVAGKLAKVELIATQYAPVAQIKRQDGTNFSFPVSYGEGGFYYDEQRKEYYFYPPASDDPAKWIK